MNIQPFIALAKNTQTEKVLEGIIEQVLSHQQIFVFGEFIQANPIIQK